MADGEWHPGADPEHARLQARSLTSRDPDGNTGWSRRSAGPAATRRRDRHDARCRDRDADRDFAALAERHRRELHVHCYRMLASFDEAEDAVQETYLRAWRGRDGFDGERAPGLAVPDRDQRLPRPAPARRAGAAAVGSFAEVPWLQPYPDRLLDEVAPADERTRRRRGRPGRRSSWRSSPRCRCCRPGSGPRSWSATCWAGRRARRQRCWRPPWRRRTAPCSGPGRPCRPTCPSQPRRTGARDPPSRARRELLARVHRRPRAVRRDAPRSRSRRDGPPGHHAAGPVAASTGSRHRAAAGAGLRPGARGRLAAAADLRQPDAGGRRATCAGPATPCSAAFKLDVLRIEDGRDRRDHHLRPALFPRSACRRSSEPVAPRPTAAGPSPARRPAGGSGGLAGSQVTVAVAEGTHRASR